MGTKFDFMGAIMVCLKHAHTCHLQRRVEEDNLVH